MAFTQETFTKDLVFEVLIRMHMGARQGEAMAAVMGHRPSDDEFCAFDNKVTMMYHGWVQMNENSRPWAKEKR